MTGEQIKWAAYMLLDLSLSLIMIRVLNRRDYASAMFCAAAFIAGFLLKVRFA